MSTLLFLAGALLCGAAGWFGSTKMKFIDLFTLVFLLLVGNMLISMGLK